MSAPAGSPGARDQHALGYDQRRNRLIVFGGGWVWWRQAASFVWMAHRCALRYARRRGGLADTWAFNLTSGMHACA